MISLFLVMGVGGGGGGGVMLMLNLIWILYSRLCSVGSV